MSIEDGRRFNDVEELRGESKELLKEWLANSRWEIYRGKNPDSVLKQIAAIQPDASLEIACRPDQSMARALEFADQVRMFDKKEIVHMGARYIGKSEFLPFYIEGLKEYKNIFFVAGDIPEKPNKPRRPYKSTIELL